MPSLSWQCLGSTFYCSAMMTLLGSGMGGNPNCRISRLIASEGTAVPPDSFRWEDKLRPDCVCMPSNTDYNDSDLHVLVRQMSATEMHKASAMPKDGQQLLNLTKVTHRMLTWEQRRSRRMWNRKIHIRPTFRVFLQSSPLHNPQSQKLRLLHATLQQTDCLKY